MRPGPMVPGGQQGGMSAGMAGVQAAPQQSVMFPQQTQIPADHQNGKNNVQLDPFGAF